MRTTALRWTLHYLLDRLSRAGRQRHRRRLPRLPSRQLDLPGPTPTDLAPVAAPAEIDVAARRRCERILTQDLEPRDSRPVSRMLADGTQAHVY
jgi:hypothetical protein